MSMENERPVSHDIALWQDVIEDLAPVEKLDPRLEEIARTFRFLVSDWLHAQK